VTAREHDSGEAGRVLGVELSIEDGELAARIRQILMGDPGVHLADAGSVQADLRLTDGAFDRDASMPVLVLGTGPGAMEALRAGARAVLSANARADALKAAIRAAAHGLTVLTEDMRDHLIARSGLDGPREAEDELVPVELTERELQVLALLAEGASNKSIARALAITPHTAKFHVASIVAKLGATGRTEAVAKAMRTGLLMI
jgi:DNA-binding NarL/FixJ family response regulator